MDDWQAMAEQAVSRILEDVGSGSVGSRARSIMEVAYLQGIIRGTELAMNDVERGFGRILEIATDSALDIRRGLREERKGQ